MERMTDTFDNWFEVIHSFESKIGYFTNETFLREVSRGDRKSILKKPSYLRIDKIYEESKKIKKMKGIKKGILPS
ncbi:hypothetical protein H5P36_22010 [Bacillus sp. APMAM]|nr:hypothetical protein [Bacillus sp. APMAM]